MKPPVRLVEAVFGPAAPYVANVQQSTSLPSQQPAGLNLERLGDSAPENSLTGWRFFGADILESRLFIVPNFAVGKPPVRVDVYLGDDVDLESPLCQTLGASVTAFSSKGDLGSLPFIRHILQCLQFWSDGREGFENAYLNLPFGSLIFLESLAPEVCATQIQMISLYHLENQWLSMQALRDMWKLPDSHWPATVDIAELRFDVQLHTAITLVNVPGHFGDRILAFKSGIRDVKYMYHELKLLLSQKAHPNVISRPMLIVTKRCRFGAKRGVCGFLLEYHPLGTLANVLRSDSTQYTQISTNTRAKWAVEIASALVHITKSSTGYFSDLKLDNIVLQVRGTELSAVLIDFEQRGAWFSWSPPEINNIVCLVYLANIGTEFGIPMSVSQRYKALLQDYLPTWSEACDARELRNTGDGYNMAWTSLAPPEREKAMVFMFGKVLWCLFEGQPTTNSATFFGAEIFREVNSQHRFPDFRRTPEVIRDLIKQCTLGAPELKGQKAFLLRVGDNVYPACVGNPLTGTANAGGDTQEVARRWWKSRLETAEAFLREKQMSPSECTTLIEAKQRPSLEQIHTVLDRYYCSMPSTI